MISAIKLQKVVPKKKTIFQWFAQFFLIIDLDG